MIWLVDYTQYAIDGDIEMNKIRSDYFKVKAFKRYQKIGATSKPKTKMFSNGLLRIATILHRNDVDIKYIHAEDLLDTLATEISIPDVIAFSVVCPTVPRAAELCRIIKKHYDIKIIVGGVHINLAPKETAERFPEFDDYISGYEFEAAEKLAHKKMSNRSGSYLDFSLLPLSLEEYGINAISAIGCPFNCTYCVDGKSPYIITSSDGMISEMMNLLPNRKLIHFCDSVLGGSVQGMIRVCKKLIELEHHFLLSCDMRLDLLTPEMVHMLEKAGFVEIRVGIENIDDDLLSRNNRTLSYKTFIEKLKMVRAQSNLYISVYSVLGIPGTTEKNIIETLNEFAYLFKNDLIDEVKNTLYVPYPIDGVDYSKQGIILDSTDWSLYDRLSYPVFHTTELSQKKMWDMYLYATRFITDQWLHNIGFHAYSEIPKIDGYYQEYIQTNYNIQDD